MPASEDPCQALRQDLAQLQKQLPPRPKIGKVAEQLRALQAWTKANAAQLAKIATQRWTLYPKISEADFPNGHPFGGDWECYVAPDPAYAGLLASSNMQEAILGGAVASPFSGYASFSRLIARPYFVSQHYGDGQDFFHHILDQYQTWLNIGGHGADDVANTTGEIPVIGAIVGPFAKLLGDFFQGSTPEASPLVYPYPFQGHHTLTYTVRAPAPPGHPPPAPGAELLVCYHFIVRDGCSVALAPAGHDGVSVTVTLDNNDPCAQQENAVSAASNVVARLTRFAPPPNAAPGAIAAYSTSLQAAMQRVQEAGKKLQACRLAHPPLYPAPALPAKTNVPVSESVHGINITIRTDQYAAPAAPRTRHDEKDLTWLRPVRELSHSERTLHTVANEQPFPVSGWLIVGWGPPAS